MNDGSNPNEKEENWGTVWPDLKPKPAYVALKTMTHELAGYRIGRRLPVGNERDYVLVCADATGGQKLAAWTTGEPHSVSVKLSPAEPAGILVVDSQGATTEAKLGSGHLILELTAAPQYVRLAKAVAASP